MNNYEYNLTNIKNALQTIHMEMQSITKNPKVINDTSDIAKQMTVTNQEFSDLATQFQQLAYNKKYGATKLQKAYPNLPLGILNLLPILENQGWPISELNNDNGINININGIEIELHYDIYDKNILVLSNHKSFLGNQKLSSSEHHRLNRYFEKNKIIMLHNRIQKDTKRTTLLDDLTQMLDAIQNAKIYLKERTNQ